MTSTNKPVIQWYSVAVGFAVASMLFFARDLLAADPPPKTLVQTAFSQKLPNVPGKTLTGIHVTYPPGGKSSSHAHAGSVYAYVLSGKVRSENSVTGPVRVYSAGKGSSSRPAACIPSAKTPATRSRPRCLPYSWPMTAPSFRSRRHKNSLAGL